MRGHTSFLVCIIHFSSPWIAKPDEVCKLFHHGFTKSHLFPFLRGSFSHPVSFCQSVFFHQLPYFFFPCYWNLTDVQCSSLTFNILFQACWLHLFLISFSRMFVLWKIGGHAVAEKETLKYLQALRKSPNFPSLHP